ncbi:MAG: hypothetical protein LBD72_00040 [Puniceicoccales bacterium]|nr:hypothetical protein [Puniceicoccales bacterium]
MVSKTIERYLAAMWWWMFFTPAARNIELESNAVPKRDRTSADHTNTSPVSSHVASIAKYHKDQPTLESQDEISAVHTVTSPVSSHVASVTKYRKDQLPLESLNEFWQGPRNNCFAIALLTCLQKTYPENYLELICQLFENDELHFRADGQEVKLLANLTGDFEGVPTDREPYEIAAATIMQGMQQPLAKKMQDNLAEYALANGIQLPPNFCEIFHPEFRWWQNLGQFLANQKCIDEQLHALQLDSEQIDNFYNFLEKKYTQIHSGELVLTLQRVPAGQQLSSSIFQFAQEDCIIFRGALGGEAFKVFFGEQAAQPVAVIDGQQLCAHARQGDFDYAPRKFLQTLLDIKQKYGLPGGAFVVAECVNYHIITFRIPKWDTMEEIEDHLVNGGCVVAGSTNWGPNMHICVAYDQNAKMTFYYGTRKGVQNANYRMGQNFFYSFNARDTRIYSPTNFKFDFVGR